MPEPDRKTLLLDLDGTLTDPYPGIRACILYALQQLELPLPDNESLRSWVGPPLLTSFREYFAARAVSADEQTALAHYRERFSDKGLFENEVYDGIPEVLSGFRAAGHNMYLATAKPHVYARRIVEHFHLDKYLVHAYGAELDGTRTDKLELLRYILEKEQLDPQNCVMVGDRKHDMIAARYHGMQAIGVLWGYGSEEELLEAGAEDLLAEPAELLRLIVPSSCS